MRITIDNANKLLSVIISTITEDDDYFTIEDENLQVFKETLLTAIDTMRKYQMIEEIYKNWCYPTYFNATDAMNKLGEVLKDGNDI